MPQQNYSGDFVNWILISAVIALAGIVMSYAMASYPGSQYMQLLIAYNASGYVLALAVLTLAFACGKYISGYFDTKPHSLPISPEAQFARYTLLALAYILGILAAFHFMGFQISNILVGSAVGGVILGLAIQSITPIILSGALVSSSKTLSRGEILVVTSSILGSSSPMICKVSKVGFLYSDLLTTYETTVRVPNTLLLSSTAFTKIKYADGFRYQVQVEGPWGCARDSQKVMDNVKRYFKSKANKKRFKVPEIYFAQKASGYNYFNCVLFFHDLSEFNELMSELNVAFDREFKASS